jgi:GtrA-like protein
MTSSRDWLYREAYALKCARAIGAWSQTLGLPSLQTAAILTAMTSNYFLDNVLTYRDRRLHGWRFLSGLVSFAALCSLGVIPAVGVSTLLYQANTPWWLAGIASAAIGAVWNYVAPSLGPGRELFCSLATNHRVRVPSHLGVTVEFAHLE